MRCLFWFNKHVTCGKLHPARWTPANSTNIKARTPRDQPCGRWSHNIKLSNGKFPVRLQNRGNFDYDIWHNN